MVTHGRRWNQLMGHNSIGLKQAFYIIGNGVKIYFLRDGRWVKLDPRDDFWELKAGIEEERHDLQELLNAMIRKKMISKEVINAHSHLDMLSKLVTCFQALWTGIQIIARLAQGLHVSLPEVITSAYVILTLITYICWLYKPYNIGLAQNRFIYQELRKLPASPVDPEELEDIADAAIHITEAKELTTPDLENKQKRKSENKAEAERSKAPMNEDVEEPQSPDTELVPNGGDELTEDMERNDVGNHRVQDFKIARGEDVGTSTKACANDTSEESLKKPEGEGLRTFNHGNDPEKQESRRKTEPVQRGYRAWEGLIENVLDTADADARQDDADVFKFPYLSRAPARFQFAFALVISTTPWLAFTLVHLAAWRYEFPTAIETWMWRVSGIYLFVGALFVALYVLVVMFYIQQTKRDTDEDPPMWESVLFGIPPFVVGSIYLAARLFIFVEIFLSLRWAPAGIYASVQWASYWGHIGG